MKLKKYLVLTVASILTAAFMVGCAQSGENNIENSTQNTSSTELSSSEESIQEEVQVTVVTLIDDERLKVDITGISNGILGAEIQFEIENRMNEPVMIQSRDISVDGMMEDPIFSVDIMPSKKARASMTFQNITDVNNLKNIEGKLVLMNADTWNDIGEYNITID